MSQSIFAINADKWATHSNISTSEKKYLKSWAQTVPARLLNTIDAIINLVMIPFSSIKVLFYYLQAFYTWDFQAKDLKDSIENLYNHTNNFVSSTIGIISTSKAQNIRYKNNIKNIIEGGLFVGAILVTVVALARFSIFVLGFRK